MVLKTSKSSRKRDWVSQEAAKIHGVTARYVNQVRNGEKTSDEILLTVIELIEGHNKLIEEVKKVVPFDKPAKRNTKNLGQLK